MWLKLRNILGPVVLILVCPPVVMLLWYTNTVLDGAISTLGDLITEQGFLKTLYCIWQPYFWGSTIAWKIIGVFAATQIILMRFLPGKTWYGPITPKGNVPEYKANGMMAFVITMILFCIASFGLSLFSASLIYDNLGAIFGALNLLSFIVCFLLYFKGRFFPSTSDSGITNNVIFDYYWGTELYPQLVGLSIKKFITCRFGMMSWGLLLISYCAKQMELGDLTNSLVISVILQLIYISKFFAWEHGYLRSLDIMHDRAGFYICWGCMVWVPCVYTSPAMYLVTHPIHLSNLWAGVILITGSLSILINYHADRQRLLTRLFNGNNKIWGKKPTIVVANYKTEQGMEKQSILLASGWWGMARHFHYIPEIVGSFFWSVPALFTHLIPYFYVIYLTVLLFDRAYRDEKRCRQKYGADWLTYSKLVPYKIVPYFI